MNEAVGRKEIAPMSAEGFGQSLIDKGIPVDKARAVEVGKIILKGGGSPELLAKLSYCFRFIDKREFDEDVDKMAETIPRILQGRDYNLALYHRRGKSGDWITNQLFEKGLPRPATDLDLFYWPRYGEEIFRPSIFIDDWSISGQQAIETAEKLKSIARSQSSEYKPEIHVLLLYARSKIMTLIEDTGAQVHVMSDKPIIGIPEVLTNNEILLLQEIARQGKKSNSVDNIGGSGKLLTFGWWRIPDNFHSKFVYPNRLGLIKIEDFFPPYKDIEEEKARRGVLGITMPF